MHWTCMTCHEPLGDDGLIVVYNANPKLGTVGTYPVRATPDEPPWADDAQHALAQDPDIGTAKEMTQAQVRDATWLVARSPNVDFGAFHFRCNPYRELSPYEIPGNLTAERWMAWVVHLHEKTWMGEWDLHRMLRFYWSHRGANPPPL